jgi:hypothetical protein
VSQVEFLASFTTSLTSLSEKARADWIKVRDQTRTRLWTKLKHPAHGAERLSALVKVGENTFRDAEQKEKRCTDRIATMAAEEGKVDTQLRDVRSRVARHEVLTAQLNELYERVFHGAGNEQDFPEEDRAEAAVKLDEQRFADVSGKAIVL